MTQLPSDPRRHQRIRRHFAVSFWMKGDEGVSQRGTALDISYGGLFVSTANLLPSGSRLRLELAYRGQVVTVEGLVVRSEKAPRHLESMAPSGMGVRFLSMSEVVHELLPGVDFEPSSAESAVAPRQYRRIRRQLDIRFWSPGERGEERRGVSLDISPGGVFVRSMTMLPGGSRLRLEIGREVQRVAAEGLVVRALRTPAHLQSVMPSGMGIRFLSMPELLAALLPGVELQASRLPSVAVKAAEPAEIPQPPPATPPAVAPLPIPDPGPEITSLDAFAMQFRDLDELRSILDRDATSGGLFIPAPRPAELNAVVRLDVGVEGRALPPLGIQARVVYRDTSASRSGMGIQFLDPVRALVQLRGLLPEAPAHRGEGGDP